MTFNTKKTGKQGYTLAGTQMQPFRLIKVSSCVDVPDAVRRRGLPLSQALLLLLMTVAVIIFFSAQKLSEADRLRAEYEDMRVCIAEVQQESMALEEKILEASDEARICYYAARELGMKLAVNSETIHIQAPLTRPAVKADAISPVGVSARR
jgi:cell division protein FtsL